MNTKMLKTSILGIAGLSSLLLPVMASADSYTIKSGDTLSKIAVEYRTTVEKIAKDNNISNVAFISVGQILELPETSDSQSNVDTKLTGQSTQDIAITSNLSQVEQEAKEIIAQRESGGSYTAQNGQYYGRYQLTISYLNGDLSPENQEKVADNYVKDRYGSWTAALSFWNVNGWY